MQYMFISADQNAGAIHSITVDNCSFERAEQFKYLRTNLTNQNCSQEEIKTDWSQEMFDIIRCRIFRLPDCCPKIWKLRSLNYHFACCFYGCETWSLTLRVERTLKVLENRGLRRIFGPKRDDVTGDWRKLHFEKLNDLYCSPKIVRVMGGACSAYKG